MLNLLEEWESTKKANIRYKLKLEAAKEGEEHEE